jgi:hypothetical protein
LPTIGAVAKAGGSRLAGLAGKAMNAYLAYQVGHSVFDPEIEPGEDHWSASKRELTAQAIPIAGTFGAEYLGGKLAGALTKRAGAGLAARLGAGALTIGSGPLGFGLITAGSILGPMAYDYYTSGRTSRGDDDMPLLQGPGQDYAGVRGRSRARRNYIDYAGLTAEEPEEYYEEELY